MKEYQSPVYKIIAVPVEKVVANNYNPNVVAPPEMKLLELSIWEDGYTMPCPVYVIIFPIKTSMNWSTVITVTWF